MIRVLKTIDAHAAGQPLRLVVEGMPSPVGATMLRKQQWLVRHADHLRRSLMLEPRGHADMCGALFTSPVSLGAHAGVLFMHAAGYTPICGHGVIAAVTIAVERQLIFDRAGLDAAGPTITLDTTVGTVQARARMGGDHRRVDTVSFTNVPSFVCGAGQVVKLGTREFRVDLAFGGAFYAMVDTEAIGLPLDAGAIPELRRVASEIREGLHGSPSIAHPVHAGLSGLDGVIFTGPPRTPAAHLRSLTVFADAAIDRSPCGTGTSAVMAVLDAMGLLPAGEPFVHESVIGTVFRGRIVRRTQVGDLPAIVPEIEGSAWITGEHTFLVDDDDPLREGFTV